MSTAAEPLIEIRGLVKHFPLTQGIIFRKQVGAVHAVDDVSLDVMRGETLGIVGETGCGKSTTARLIMRLHQSNYRIIGFTTSPTRAETSALAHEAGLALYEDAGSGVLADLSQYGLADEPIISECIADGADVVSFSGDKLLGSTQAGLIVGRHAIVGRLRKHPLYRALRADKLCLAALEVTLESHRRGKALDEVPVLRMLGLTRQEIEERARSFLQRYLQRVGSSGLTLEIVEGTSAIGGGSTWLTGSYDWETDTLYWPTATPYPNTDDRDRPGDLLEHLAERPVGEG